MYSFIFFFCLGKKQAHISGADMNEVAKKQICANLPAV